MSLAIGLMSGTSMDGIDAALVRFESARFDALVATHSGSYPAELRARLLKLARETHAVTLHDLAALDNAVARAFADTAHALLSHAGVSTADIVALGSHGQTVLHDPQASATLQLGNPSLIAALTGITTVADFRRKDLALGGHGAPLVPAFHHAMFAAAGEPRCVVNIGGIANVTVLPGDAIGTVRGFDIGPGNGLLDEWCEAHLGRPFDHDGQWAAAGGAPEPQLLHALLDDPYFRQAPPKSTGRRYFNLAWLRARFPEVERLPPEQVQSTLCALTARTIAEAIRTYAPATRRVLLCGGGGRNRLLIERLAHLLASMPVAPTGDYGLDARWVEAAAFAWLALRTVHGLPGNLPAVTGASRETVLGGIFKA